MDLEFLEGKNMSYSRIKQDWFRYLGSIKKRNGDGENPAIWGGGDKNPAL